MPSYNDCSTHTAKTWTSGPRPAMPVSPSIERRCDSAKFSRSECSFLVPNEAEQLVKMPITVVLNWRAGLKPQSSFGNPEATFCADRRPE